MKLKNGIFYNLLTKLSLLALCIVCGGGCTSQIKEFDEAEQPSLDYISPDVTVNLNQEVELKIVASVGDGGTLSYQWYFGIDEFAEGTIIEQDANLPSFFPDVTKTGLFYYRCKITNNLDGSTETLITPWISVTIIDEQLQDITIEKPVFMKQPVSMNIAPHNQSVILSCEAVADGFDVKYKWYETTDGTTEAGIDIQNAEGVDTASFKTPVYTEPGIHYYYCEATTIFAEDEDSDVNTVSSISNIVSVAYTGLPTIFINTENSKPVVSKEEKVSGSFKLVASGIKANYEDVTSDIEIKCRGNSSYKLATKKSYSIKLSNKKELLGMERSKKWALLANYFDKTLLRCSYVSYLNQNIFTNLGWNPSYVHVDVVLNGEYIGNYILAEKIQIDEERLNISDISKVADINEGGFICEVNERWDEPFNFRTAHGISATGETGIAISLKDPDEVSEEIQEKVKQIVQAAEDALFSEEFDDEENGYAKYFDIDSLVDWYCLHEYIKMRDATVFYTSAYFYYDTNDEKIHMGPCWDYDTGAGNSTDSVNCQPEGFDLCTHASWFVRLWEDENFKQRVKNRWNEKYSDVSLSLYKLQDWGDSMSVSVDYNFVRWPVLGKQTGLNAAGYEERTTYQSELDFMTDWLSERLIWLNENINQ